MGGKNREQQGGSKKAAVVCGRDQGLCTQLLQGTTGIIGFVQDKLPVVTCSVPGEEEPDPCHEAAQQQDALLVPRVIRKSSSEIIPKKK